MAKQLFKGFKQVSGDTSFENGFIYFVRQDESGHGFIRFNGKNYSTTKEVADALSALTNEDVLDVIVDGEGSSKTIKVKFKDDTVSQTGITISTLFEGLDATVSGSDDVVEVQLTQVSGVVTEITVSAPNGVNAVVTTHSAEVTIDADDIQLGADISGVTGTTTVYAALVDLYSKISATQCDSSDSSIEITSGATGYDFVLNRETSTDSTVAAGHLEIALNASGETYAVMYYDGNDAPDTNS